MILSAPALADVTGPARVVDGDTLEVAGKRIRLHGFGAPESAQSCERDGVTWLCGAEASMVLPELAKGELTCQERDRDRYGRIVTACRAGDIDINAAMVWSGYALAYRRYSTDYVGQEATAQAARRGMWAGRFVAPWDWRQGKRLTSEAANENRPPAARAKPKRPAGVRLEALRRHLRPRSVRSPAC